MEMTPRKLNGLTLMCIGGFLILVTQPLAQAMSNSKPLVLAGIEALAPLGLIFLVLGIYRFSSKEKKQG